MQLREATRDDLELLYDLLLEAFSWDGTARLTRDEVVADVHTVRYLGGWRRAGDIPEIGMGVIRGRRGQGVGSALLADCLEQARVLGWRRRLVPQTVSRSRRPPAPIRSVATGPIR